MKLPIERSPLLEKIQKLKNNEEVLNNEINFMNIITNDTKVKFININHNISSHHKGDNNICGNFNMIYLVAKKMLKNSIFGKYLII